MKACLAQRQCIAKIAIFTRMPVFPKQVIRHINQHTTD